MRRILVWGAVLAGVLVLAGTARAGVWTYDTCSQPDGASASIVGWASSSFGGGVGAGGDTDSCGSAGGGLGATQDGDVPQGGGPAWVFTAPAGDTIAGGVVDATLSVPSGEDWIATPDDTNTGADDFAYCAAATQPSPSVCDAPTAWPITHPGGTTIYAVARCYQSSCPSENTLVAQLTISSAQIELQDSSLPSASGFSGPLLSAGAHGTADVLFTAGDPRVAPGTGDGPGVYSVTAAVDGTPVWSGTPNTNGGMCVPIAGGPSGGGLMFDTEQPCPTQTSVDIPVNTTTLANGDHELTVSVTDAAGNAATVLDQEISVANPVTGTTTAPGHSPRREVNARFKIVWKVSGERTRIERIFDVHLPRHGSVAVRCLGSRCPKLRLRSSSARRVSRLWRELEHARFSSKQRLVITISAPKLRPEPIELRFRDRHTPSVKRLKKPPR